MSQANTFGAKRTVGNSSERTDSRVAFVDYAKGWCIVLVVMMHSTLGLTERVGSAGWLNEFIAFARPFRMPDFFLMAGLFATRSLDAEFRSFIDRKVVHFAYFYILWMTLQLLIKRAGILVSDPVQFGHEYMLSLVEPFGTLWFIYVLPLMYFCARVLKSIATIPVLFLASAVRLLEIQTGWAAADNLATYLVFFLAGIRLSRQVLSFAGWCMAHPILTAHGLIIWAVANGWAVHTQLAGAEVAATMLGAMGALAVVAGSALLARGDRLKALRYAGRHSLAVYLAFFVPMVLTRVTLISAGCIWNVDAAAVVITTVAIIVPLGAEWMARGTRFQAAFIRPAWLRLCAEDFRAARPGLAGR